MYFCFSLLHVDPSCRLSIEDVTNHSWLEEAPDNELHSPAVIADKVITLPHCDRSDDDGDDDDRLLLQSIYSFCAMRFNCVWILGIPHTLRSDTLTHVTTKLIQQIKADKVKSHRFMYGIFSET